MTHCLQNIYQRPNNTKTSKTTLHTNPTRSQKQISKPLPKHILESTLSLIGLILESLFINIDTYGNNKEIKQIYTRKQTSKTLALILILFERNSATQGTRIVTSKPLKDTVLMKRMQTLRHLNDAFMMTLR